MDFNKFLQIVKDAGVSARHDHCYDPDALGYRGEWQNEERHYIKAYWSTGGTGGGSCWSDGGHYGLSGDPEEELTELDTIVNLIAPNISFMQYKMHIAPLVKMFDWTDYGYYGNSTKYRSKVVFLDELYDTLSEMGLFDKG